MPGKRYLVLGGGGYLGGEFCRCLDAAVCHTRTDAGIPGAFVHDLTVPFSLPGEFDWVINCSGVVNSRRKSRYEDNAVMTRNILAATGSTRLLHISSVIVKCREKGPYARSKQDVERLIRRSSDDCVIVRLPYLYGIDPRNSLARLVRMVRHHLVPFPHGGDFRIQPTNKTLLVRRILMELDGFQPGTVVEMGSEDRIVYRDLVDMISGITGSAYMPLHIPGLLLRAMAGLLEFDARGFGEDRVTSGNEILVRQDLAGDIGLISSLTGSA